MSLKSLLLVGCIFSACASPPAHVRCVDEVNKTFNELVKSERELICLGSGGYFSQKSVTGLYIDFELRKPCAPDEAKQLLMKMVEEFTQHVNRSEKLRVYLKKHPLTAKDISLSIAFVDKEHRPFAPLAQIHLYEGRIYYSNYDPTKKAYIAFLNEGYPD